MQAIASTYHQVVRFIGINGRQEDLRGDQIASKKCYVSAVHNSTKAKQVQWVEIPNITMIDDVGQQAEDKAEEDLVQMPINENGSRFFLISSSISEAEREDMYHHLKKNIKVFAWTPNEMPGVDPDFIKQYSRCCKNKSATSWKLTLMSWSSKQEGIQPPQDLAKVFEILKLHKLWLNSEKCAFGVSAGKFLGHLVTRRGIEADPNQIKAVKDLRPPRTIKKGKSQRSFEWTSDCDSALAELKEYLNSAPLMVKPKEFETLYFYLSVSAHATSSALVRRDGANDMPIYFTSKTLLLAQTRYLPLEKLALALVSVARKLLPYFQSHPIVVLTKHPLKSLFRKADLSNRVLVDFIAELTPEDTELLNTPILTQTVAEHQLPPKPWHLFQGNIWRLHVDGASNSNGAGAGVVLVSPCGTLHESAISIEFPATNNEAEYEALIASLRSAVEMGISDLVVYCDSQLIVNQINREHNAHADALANLASTSKASEFRTISFGSIDHPSFDTTPEILNVELGRSWMDEIVAFLKNDTLPTDKKEAYRIRIKSAYYWLSESSQLYRKSISGPYLLVVHPTQVPEILAKLHSGSCGCHSGGRSLCQRALSQGYFWKNKKKDCEDTVRKCQPCQLFSPIPKQPAQNLSPITSPWPFAQWGLDIVEKLPTAPGGFKFGVPYAIVSDNRSQFVSKDLTSLCAEFGIRFFNSTPAYPHGNGQAEATNKTVCAGIKRRLNSKRGKWAEELPRVLWAYRSTPRRSIGQTPVLMAFGMEAVIPLESKFPTLRTKNFDPKTNEEVVEQELILAKEKRDDTQLKLAEDQQQVVQANKKQKFKPNWEGPFRVVKIAGEGAYVLEDMTGKVLTNPWNAQNLKKAYM
ncbi:uncharacterized protein LOC131321150 [Rhododendron vialii]|uniref:uncharacterized protein LOC131321150 n=1 Tax=Rhododendron vialii TaxID=182163 RepID=UPI00265FCB74|nr:uncharacterized protein LOC131321150 [Rhododendron vialii]